MANDKAKKKAAKRVEKAVRKAVKNGLTKNAVGKAVSLGIGNGVKKKPVGKAAAQISPANSGRQKAAASRPMRRILPVGAVGDQGRVCTPS